MTKPLSNSPKQNKPPDPIMTSTSSLSKSSLASSAASLSPSTSILLSAVANRTAVPTGSSSSSSSRNNSYRKGQPPVIPLSSSSSISTSSSSNRNAKLESIIQNFYTKTAQIIIQSRIPNMKNTSGKKKLNKWFNITTSDNEKLKEELKFWKSLVKYQQEEEEPPPLVIDIYLETTEPDLLQEGDDVYGWRKLDLGIQQNDVQRILVESWTLSLNHPLPDYPVDLPNLYKRSIVFFRSLHSLVRVLPSYSLYQRLKLHNGEISLGYRLSTNHFNRKDEISLDHALTSVDTIQLYEFSDISTPLGTFKLKLLFREHCKFDTKEDSPLHGIDVEENFFTPTMTKYRMEKSREKTMPSPPPPPVPVFPTASSVTSAKSRLQSQRSTSAAASASISSRSNHYPMTSISSTTASGTNTHTSQLERRISAPLVSPFKSPSLSSSPQKELMFTSSNHSRSDTPERPIRPESGSFGRKPEFSSSFEKFFSKGNTHSGSSNASASSSIHHHMHRVGSSNNVAAGDTMTEISMTRRWSRTSDHSSINLESEEDEEDLEEFMRFIAAKQELKLFQQQTSQPSFTAAASAANDTSISAAHEQAEKGGAMKPLSHFKNIQETHTILSDSMILSQPQLKQQTQQQQQHQANYSYESSSSSSLTKGLNLPAIPSPLHATESAIHPIANATAHTRAVRHNDTSFNRHSAAEVVTFSPLKNRQAPPPPPPPKMPVRQHCTSSSGGALDDDDSLVFKMSELSGYDENAPSSGHDSSFYYGSNRGDYLQRLKMAAALNDDDNAVSNRMKRAVSTGGTPNSIMNTATAAVLLDSSESSSKSDPAGSISNKFKTTQQDQGAKMTRRFFYDGS
ncbi:uncharacterized protein ATC70_003105 [Mucor velutinosus]|uniref:Autophagy-related protein 13 n=1 Tax=Mucor velutinosus TaxID=708070 RepID=A0AAN7HYA3_9FUNG|nr:hypothetical protein ATC70_003105 [Mucor velutinosus]